MEKHEQYLLSHSCLLHILQLMFLYFYSIHNGLFLRIVYFVSGTKCWFLIRFGHFRVERPATIKLMGNCYSLCDLYPESYSSNQVTCYQSSLTTPHSCSRHGLDAAGFTSQRPGSVTHLSKNIQPRWKNIQSVNASVFGTVVAWWCVSSASALTSLPLQRRAKKQQVMRPMFHTKPFLTH